jgi:O-antigen ligase
VSEVAPSGAAAAAPGRRALVFAGAALVVALVPLGGVWEWPRFIVASAFVVVAVLAHRDGFAAAAAALFVTIAVKDGVLVVPGAYVGLFHVVLAGTIGAAATRAVRTRALPKVRLTGAEWALGLLPLAGLWSLPASLDAGQTALATARLVMLWAAALVVSRALSDRRSLRVAVVAFVLAALPLALVALAQWAFPELGIGSIHQPVPGGQIRPAGFYMDPNFLGAHLVLAALAALASAGNARRWPLWTAAAAGMFGIVALTYSRSAWLEAAVGIAALLVIGTRRVRVATLVVAIAAVLAGTVLLGPSLVTGRALSIFETGAGSSNATRILMVRSTLTMIAERPVFGTGLKAFEVAYPDYVLPGADPSITHPHQVALALVAETGIAGAVALVALAITGVRAMVRARRGGSAAGAAATVGVLVLGVGSFFQYFLYFELAWLFAGLLAASARCAAGGAPSAPAVTRS